MSAKRSGSFGNVGWLGKYGGYGAAVAAVSAVVGGADDVYMTVLDPGMLDMLAGWPQASGWAQQSWEAARVMRGSSRRH